MCKEWLQHFLCSWRIIGAWFFCFFFPGYHFKLMTCVCYCDGVWNNIWCNNYYCLSKKLLKMLSFTCVVVVNLHNLLCWCYTKYDLEKPRQRFKAWVFFLVMLWVSVKKYSREKCFRSRVQQYSKDLFSFPPFRCDRLRIIPLLPFSVEAQVILCTLHCPGRESQLVFVCTCDAPQENG